jgi:hypothetical protein
MTTRNVYDKEQQALRVSFACARILSGGATTRAFDTCFEMGDGNEVAARVYRRALKNPRLMEALPRYLNVDMARRDYFKVFGGAE